ncbi:MAG: glycosyltransferase family 4 protein [Vicinamibacterales bacterium]|jgi:glycosyltransferase involved in cell wall biosynthesis|nr:glycosyltransferase family 4 protein [Vicinamibacterales bacterium]
MTAPSSQPRPAVHQVLATLGYGDAIGNEVLGICSALRSAGYESEVFVETADPRLEPLTHDYRDLIEASHPDNILIHHFSIGSRASRIAYALPDRMVLVYHNITPPEFFVGVHEDLVRLCYSGRRELRAYVPRCDLALGDSEFNRQELQQFGFPHTGVLPVVPNLAHLHETPDRTLVSEFDDERVNILFVGRIIPSKRIEDVIRFYQAFRLKHQPNARLLLVGAHGGFESYLATLHHLIATLRVPDVHIMGHVSNAELTACYDVADLFLSASEHEGFCVPLIEAFHKRIPVVAYASTAVPSTMDGAGVLYETKDPRHVAAIMDTVLSNPALESEIVRGQDSALDRLLAHDFKTVLCEAIDQVSRSARRPRTEVRWDFWQRFGDWERLEELRLYRPSAYKALPFAPGERGENL